MHFSSLALPVLALFSAASAQTVTVFSDAACSKQIQVIKFTQANVFQCAQFKDLNAQGAIISKAGYTNRGFNVWDSEYCAGDMAGGLPSQQGTCLSAANFGLAAWKSAHIAPRNITGGDIKSGLLTGLPVVTSIA